MDVYNTPEDTIFHPSTTKGSGFIYDLYIHIFIYIDSYLYFFITWTFSFSSDCRSPYPDAEDSIGHYWIHFSILLFLFFFHVCILVVVGCFFLCVRVCVSLFNFFQRFDSIQYFSFARFFHFTSQHEFIQYTIDLVEIKNNIQFTNIAKI